MGIVDNICAAIPDNIGELGGAVFWDIVSQLPRGWETNVISGNIKFRSFAKAKTDGSARAILKVFLKRDSAENSQKNRKQCVKVADARAMTDGEGLISFQLTSPLAFGEGTTGVALVCDNCQFQYENGNEINQEFKTDDYSLVANGAQSLPFISDVIAGRSWPFCIGDIKLNQCWNKKCGCPGNPDVHHGADGMERILTRFLVPMVGAIFLKRTVTSAVVSVALLYLILFLQIPNQLASAGTKIVDVPRMLMLLTGAHGEENLRVISTLNGAT